MSASGIYQIKNNINDRIYIGSAVNINKRWGQHKWDLKNNRHHSQYLQNSYNKYGDVFVYSILFTCPVSELLRIEQYFLNNYNPDYNICPTAGSVLGRKHSEETKKKISESNIGKKHTEESKKLIGEKSRGRIVSQSTRDKISQVHRGRIISPETRIKYSAWQKGRKLTEDQKDKNMGNRYTAIVQLCSTSNIVLNEFKSMKEASVFFNIAPSSVHNTVTGRSKLRTGIVLKYKKDIENGDQ